MRPLLFLGMAFIALASLPAANPIVLRSGQQAVPLLELFTSEGCSSCPPAEAWLGKLRHDDGLWRDFVPLAWHVNYWDRLGWPDRFAERVYTDRQYAYARAWRSGRVYTPGFVRAGREWRPREGTPSGRAEVVGELIVQVEGDRVTVHFAHQPEQGRELEVHVARLGGGIVSEVKRGENRGRRLEHEFLVLGWTRGALLEGEAQLILPTAPADLAVPRAALAVWISAVDSPAPLQAVGGWLPDSS